MTVASEGLDDLEEVEVDSYGGADTHGRAATITAIGPLQPTPVVAHTAPQVAHQLLDMRLPESMVSYWLAAGPHRTLLLSKAQCVIACNAQPA